MSDNKTTCDKCKREMDWDEEDIYMTDDGHSFVCEDCFNGEGF